MTTHSTRDTLPILALDIASASIGQRALSASNDCSIMATELKGFGRSSQINSEFSSQIHLKSTEELFKPHPCSRRPVKLLLLALVILLATGAGFLAGFFVPKTSSRQASNDNNNLKNTTINYQQKFLDMVDRQEMMKTLR